MFLILISCGSPKKKNHPVIGFLDLLTDETLAEAKKGFFTALKDAGYNQADQTIEIIYRNAQNDQPTLLQACDYLISQQPDLIASNPSLSTITAVQRTKNIPVFMMVSPAPQLMGFETTPKNLFGTYETLDYIDTAFQMIFTLLPGVKKIGTIYNQSEPQSMDAFNRIRTICQSKGIELISQPVNSSAETQLTVSVVLEKKVDAFFALPDNTVFSSMEVIVKSCDLANVPVFTSEEGLVKRGALAAFGADMYLWGYQSGKQAAEFLNHKSTEGLKPELVKIRHRVFNPAKALLYSIQFDSTFTAVK